MMDRMSGKIRSLFDYQRFEQDPELQGIIDGVGLLLSDDELEFAAAGMENGASTAKTKELYCNKCKKTTVFRLYSGTRAVCSICKSQQEV